MGSKYNPYENMLEVLEKAAKMLGLKLGITSSQVKRLKEKPILFL